MKIQDKDMFHGAALTQIVESSSFKALNKVDRKYGHYTVNADRRLFVKYRTGNDPPWQFIFHAKELRAIRQDLQTGALVFACLVCGDNTICCLDDEEMRLLINIDSNSRQWIRVDVPMAGSLHVSGSAGKLARTIPHNAFPGKLLT